ncbi:MAG: sulfite exporter TauE/SafE family protein, partial [Vampirovibrionia bacterium]
LIGSVLSKYLSGDLLIWTYVVVLFSAAILMLVRHADKGSENLDVTLNKFKRKLFLLGLIIGVPCGILGLAGSVIIIPLLNSLFDVPIKICISSGTHIAFIASFVAVLGKLITGQLELFSAVIISVSATIGAYIGTKLNKKANPIVLKWILFVIILIALTKILLNILAGY